MKQVDPKFRNPRNPVHEKKRERQHVHQQKKREWPSVPKWPCSCAFSLSSLASSADGNHVVIDMPVFMFVLPLVFPTFLMSI